MRHAITMPSSTGSSPLKGCGVNCRPGGKQWQPTVGFMTYITCRLIAKNRDQPRNPTLGNRVWATFTVFTSTGGIKQCCNLFVCLSVCLSHAPSSKRCILGPWFL